MMRPDGMVTVFLLGLLIGSVEPCRLFAEEDPDAGLQAIVKEWNDAQARARQTKEKISFEPYGERCFQLVEAYPQSVAAMRALVFVVSKAPHTSQATRAIKLLKPRVIDTDL